MTDRTNNLKPTFGTGPNAISNDKKSGFVRDAGPYVGTVVSHIKGSRMGGLKVYIPDWGAQDEMPDDGVPVSYASPFYGTTYGTDTQSTPDSPVTAGQSYGMWFVPPDIGNKVLVTFAAGDINRGYWFACVYDSGSHHMVPGIARNIGGQNNTLAPSDQLGSMLTGDTLTPVIEYSSKDTNAQTADGLVTTKRFPHEYQTGKLIAQGLERDPVRGAISSSSLRESPSNVYGISTPGAKGTPGDQIPNNPDLVIFRKGGHQFVMDDGDKDGNDQLIRLRTSAGHQILMNDSVEFSNDQGTFKTGVLYIGSASGNQWLEFSPDGSINIYGAAGFNLRSSGPINMHSDSAVNIQGAAVNITAKSSGAPGTQGGALSGLSNNVTIQSAGSLQIKAVTTASIRSTVMMNIGSGVMNVGANGILNLSSLISTRINGATILLNSPYLPIPVPPALDIVTSPHQDVVNDGSKGWAINEGVLQSVCTLVPTHEPWTKDDYKTRPDPSKVAIAAAIAGAIL